MREGDDEEGGSGKRSTLGYTLKVDLIEFANGLDLRCEQMEAFLNRS